MTKFSRQSMDPDKTSGKAQNKLKISVQNLIFLILIYNFSFLISHFSLDCFAQDKLVAIVNNDIITQKDLNDFINFMRIQLAQELKAEQLETKIQSMKSDLLDRLIEDRLILQKAKKENVKVDENRIKARIEEIKRRYASEGEFQNALCQQGLTQADIELRIREQLLMYNIIDTEVKSKILINPAEVTDFYQKNIQDFRVPQQREFESITVDEENLAKKIFNELKNNRDFNAVAQEYSLTVNRLSAKQGEELRKEIEGVIFKVSLGEISEPVEVNGSFYIFKLVNIIPPRLQSLSEVQDRIYAFLFDKKMQEELTGWLDELKKQAYIKIFSD